MALARSLVMRRPLPAATALFSLLSVSCQHQPPEQRGATTATAAATIVAVAPQVAPPKGPAPAAPSAAKPAGLDAPVHLPPKVAAGSKVPLFVMLHGLGSSAEMI